MTNSVLGREGKRIILSKNKNIAFPWNKETLCLRFKDKTKIKKEIWLIPTKPS